MRRGALPRTHATQLLSRLAAEAPGLYGGLFDAAKHIAAAHRRVIARFGRFPARNAALQRATTAEEQHFLAHGADDAIDPPTRRPHGNDEYMEVAGLDDALAGTEEDC